MHMSSVIPYNDCLQTMYGLKRFGIKLGLSTITEILDGLGNPQQSYRCIHIAGTNGKGSIASTLSSILSQAGCRVGLYTSPHLVRFNERITINGQPIADDDVVSAYHAVGSVHRGSREPTFFEFTTAMALYEFARRQVEWAVIETGMGGRLDATNIIDPAVCVISNVSVEHKEYLGGTIAQIAAEKGGIIKKQVPLVTGVRQKTAVEVIKTIASDKQAPFKRLGKQFRFRRTGNGAFNYHGMNHTWRNLRSGLNGSFQTENAALALAVCEVLMSNRAVDIEMDDIRSGLSGVRWPGRLEIVSQNPLVILDGAHNRAAAANLAEYISCHLADRNVTLVIGILDDKPYAAMLKSLLPLCSRVILTRPRIDRSLAPETLRSAAEKFTKQTEIIPDVGDAVRHAIETTPSHQAVCIAGSLYVVGEAKAWLERHGP